MASDIITRVDARAQGLKRFYTNIPCSHGHLSERFVRDGGCVACIYVKNAAWAKRNPEKKRDSLARWNEANAAYVKLARKTYHAEWYKANRVDKLAKNAAHVRAHPEAARRAVRKWREANIEVSRAKCREWERANPEKRRALTKKKYQANPEHYKAKNAKWARDNPEKKAVVTHRRRARKAAAGGTHTAADLADILRMQKHRCAHPGCGADLRKVGKHLDHITPLALGGSNDRRNLQWLCPPHNMSKGAKDPIIYAQSIGLLL